MTPCPLIPRPTRCQGSGTRRAEQRTEGSNREDPPSAARTARASKVDANGLVLDAIVPAGSGWQAGLNGFKYKSRSGTPDGVTQILLKIGADGKAKILVQGKDAAFGVPSLTTVAPCSAPEQQRSVLGGRLRRAVAPL